MKNNKENSKQSKFTTLLLIVFFVVMSIFGFYMMFTRGTEVFELSPLLISAIVGIGIGWYYQTRK